MTQQHDRYATFLGTGSSNGVPVIGCSCDVCSSSDPKNRRMRCSLALHIDGSQFIIDAGPDFREQALQHKISRLDGLLLTHTHYDHVGGLDDLRIYCFRQQAPISCLLSKEAEEDLRVRHKHFFEEYKEGMSFATNLSLQVLPSSEGTTTFQGKEFSFFSYQQGPMPVTGYRFENLAYVTDIRTYEETIFSYLENLDILILSALRHEPSPMHLSIEEACAFAERTGARQVWLIHVGHALDHEATNKALPPHIQVAYDGLQIPF